MWANVVSLMYVKWFLRALGIQQGRKFILSIRMIVQD